MSTSEDRLELDDADATGRVDSIEMGEHLIIHDPAGEQAWLQSDVWTVAEQ